VARLSVFTVLAAAIPPLGAWAWVAVVRETPSPTGGFYGGWDGLALVELAGPLMTVFAALTIIALVRREPWAGRIIYISFMVSVLIAAALTPSAPAVSVETDNKERSRTWGASGSIHGFAVQADDKIVIAGAGIARLLPDGTRDRTFAPRIDEGVFRRLGMCSEYEPVQLAIQADGKILVAGDQQLSRLNPDASIDSSFHAPAPDGTVYAMDILPGGRILLVGSFWHMGPALRWGIARVLSNGPLDDKFRPPVEGLPEGSANSYEARISSFVVESDGRIVIAGLFSATDDRRPCDLARLNADGTWDRGFEPVRSSELLTVQRLNHSIVTIAQSPATNTFSELGAEGGYRTLPLSKSIVGPVAVSAPLKDGGLLVGGRGLWRILPDGRLDASFARLDWARNVESVALQGDKILVLCDHKLYRLNPDGDRDTTFALVDLPVHRGGPPTAGR